MDIRIQRDDLAAALSPAANVAEKRSTTPILGCLLLQATGETLRVTATDKALTYTGEHSGELVIVEPGEIAIELRGVGRRPRRITGQPLSSGIDAHTLLENRECRGVDALTAFAAQTGQASRQVVGDAADGQLFGHAGMISQTCMHDVAARRAGGYFRITLFD